MAIQIIGTYEGFVELHGTSAKGDWTCWQVNVKHERNQQYGDKCAAVSIWKPELMQEVNRLAQGNQTLVLDCSVESKLIGEGDAKRYVNDIRCFRVSAMQIQGYQQPQPISYATIPQQQTMQAVAPSAQMHNTQYAQPMQATPSYGQQGGFTAPAMAQGGYYGGGDNNNPPF